MGSRLRFGYTAQMVFVCFFICLLLFLLLHSEHLSFCYKQIKIKIKKEGGKEVLGEAATFGNVRRAMW